MEALGSFEYNRTINEICSLNWDELSQDHLVEVAWSYYYFSVQFRESLQIARKLLPNDQKLMQLEREECNTDNLSPWPGVADAKEKMNHDEFMRRTLQLSYIGDWRRSSLEEIGQFYLDAVRGMDFTTRALSIASYEDGGLEKVFRSFLKARYWDNPLLQAFRHFLVKHIEFDSDPGQGHGALSRHLTPDDRILPLWMAFKQLLVEAVPKLAGASVTAAHPAA